MARNRKRAREHNALARPDGEAEGAQPSNGEPADEEPEQMATEYASAEPEDDGDDEFVPERHPAHPAAPQESLPARLTGFIRGSWRELQRVQWPDRRQVAQATGVVLGFVIVAGCFLGVADLVASKLVNLILK